MKTEVQLQTGGLEVSDPGQKPMWKQRMIGQQHSRTQLTERQGDEVRYTDYRQYFLYFVWN
jgi:hypothetical protein